MIPWAARFSFSSRLWSRRDEQISTRDAKVAPSEESRPCDGGLQISLRRRVTLIESLVIVEA
jgi:hypothetical protein